MDTGQTTTRKGFLKGAGLALAGLFAFGGARRLAGRVAEPERVASAESPRAMSRVRRAKGAVERKIVS